MLLVLLLAIFVPSTTSVSVRWGLPDASVQIGQLFRYKIPDDAFDGVVERYQIHDMTTGSLPSWLAFDQAHKELHGVPQVADRITLEVRAYGGRLNDTHVSMAVDAFSISVRERPQREDCKDELLVMLVLEGSLDSMSPSRRASLIEKAHLQLKVEQDDSKLRLTRHADLSPAAGLLQAGPGTARKADVHDDTPLLWWPIGCGTVVPAGLDGRVAQAEHVATSGEAEDALGTPVISWEVYSLRIARRRRRMDWWGKPTPKPTDGLTTTMQPPPELLPEPVVTQPPHIDEDSRTTKRQLRPEVTPAPPTQTRTRKPNDQSPEIVTNLGTLTCNAGELCRHKVPDSTFVDAEDGDTSLLTLELVSGDPSSEEHLTLDSKPDRNRAGHASHTLVGLFMDEGVYEYALKARDLGNNMKSDAFAIKVVSGLASDEDFTQSIQVKMKGEFSQWKNNVTKQVAFMKRVARFYGDLTPRYITLRALFAGTVTVEFSNNTLSKTECDRARIEEINRYLVRKDLSVRHTFRKFMQPEFEIEQVVPLETGACLQTDTATKGTTDGVRKEPAAEAGAPDTFLTTVVPIIVIVVLLLICAAIAFALYRRNRNRKHTPGSSPGGKSAKDPFVSKGTPVVFPNEYDEVQETCATTPMLVKDEKPPLPIPDMAIQSFGTNPLYQPPPPPGATSAPRANSGTPSRHNTSQPTSQPFLGP